MKCGSLQPIEKDMGFINVYAKYVICLRYFEMYFFVRFLDEVL